MTIPVILASTSPFRRQLLEQAGLRFTAMAPDIDEREVEGRAEHQHVSPQELAQVISCEKALAVSRQTPDGLVIGGDQVLALGERIYHKPKDLSSARDQLLSLRGETHVLYSALALAKQGEVIWRHVSQARMTMRMFSETFLDDYLDRAGGAILKSVGGYQIEGLGVQLFSDIVGDYFTIVGVPLLPLMEKLRELDIVHA
ncbi:MULTISPECIES: Maf family nucleotide pyrophosphatase [Rhizobium/Agrobacterium group]|uniref:Maf family nucleotide pyrophosphatase n=1 Tax=Rhizobium/Agrobacterium group TaxID=227290 RepID=UPI0012E7F612|nr:MULTISPECIES: Maf family nucleotide pyrophosphatase [Rhizobium/Agrobacterium group]MCF1474096.1 septum formation protein Maf [Allorhizobium ampelinum]MVA53366.1 septum formation protein Maf [Agrobacterium vitis]NSZ51282.1 septum formation protein Maf [Agrobacterium vitis]NTA33283.1 septum formation protein Maf [Agrobacterium vitis]